jgi:integrase/recombinase XerC
VAGLIDDYLSKLQLRRFSPHTLRAYRSDLAAAQKDLGPLELVPAEVLEAYIDGLSRRGLKASTVRRKQSSLRRFYQYAIRARACAADPTTGFVPPKMEDRLPVYLNDNQVLQLLAVLGGESPEDVRERAMVLCLYYTGMRAGELAGLDFAHVRLNEGGMRVFGKGRRERELPIHSVLRQALEAWMAIHPVGRGALFVGLRQPHRRLKYGAVRLIYLRAIERAGLAGRGFSCHKMRHTFATRLVRRATSIDKIQKLLGHRRIDTTTIYAHTDVGAELRGQLEQAL